MTRKSLLITFAALATVATLAALVWVSAGRTVQGTPRAVLTTTAIPLPTTSARFSTPPPSSASVPTTAKKSSERPTKSSAPTTTTTVPAPTGPTLELGSLRMQVPETWGGGMSGDGYINMVDNTTCTLSNAQCPHVYVFDLSSPSMQGAAADPIVHFMQKTCGVSGQPAYDFAKLQEVVSIAGVNTRRYEQVICPPGGPQLTGFFWWFKEREILVHNVNPGTTPAHGLNEALRTITWK